MGRNKKKSKAQHVDDDSDHSGSEDNQAAVDATVPEPSTDAGETRQAASRSNSPAEHSDDEGEHKKKKEYRGNKLKRLEDKKSKKDQKKKGEKANEAAKRKEANAEGSDDDSNGSDDDDGEIVVTRQEAVEVLYCPICTFPAEMCEFSGMMEKCRPWLQEHAAELADAEERGRKRRILTQKERLEAMVEGRGVKRAIERVVVMDVEKRTGKRMITSVTGMDLFGFNLKDLSKDWRKVFACGVGIREPEEGKHQQSLDIQGSVEDRLAEMLVTKYEIPKESVYIIQAKKKVRYFD